MQQAARPSIAPVLWLLPFVFVVHDGEELLTMPGWIERHGPELERLAQTSRLAARLIRTLATSPAQVAVAIGAVFAVIVGVTIGATVARQRGLWFYAYLTVLGALFLHVFTHVAQSIYFGGYTPGVAGAVCAVLPGSLYIYRRLFQAGLLTWRAAVATALLGFALFIPAAIQAHRLGRLLVNH